MPRDVITPAGYMRGEVRLHRVRPLTVQDLIHERRPDPAFEWLPRRWAPLTDYVHNDFLYEWGAIFGSLLLRKGLTYGIGGMYIEFENVGSPGDPVSVPTFTRDAAEGVDYYNALSGSPDRDYLRVPLVSATLDSSDPVNFPKGNRPVFFAQTAGVTGVHGKPFSDADNSTVFGGALVAFVDDADPTRDLVLSRFYLSADNQQVKLATSQVGLEWRVTLN